MLGGDHQVGSQGDLEAAAHGQAVDGADHRLVPPGELGKAAEATLAVVRLERLATGCGLEVPPGREEPLPGTGEDGNAQFGVVAKAGEDAAQFPTGGGVDGVGLRPVQHDLEHPVIAGRGHGATHAAPSRS